MRSRITTPSRNRTEWHRLTYASSGVLYIMGIVSSTWISSKRPTLALPNVFLLEFTDSFLQHNPRKISNIRVHRTTRSKEFLAGLLLPVSRLHVHIASVTVLEFRVRCRWRACFWPDTTRFQAVRQFFPHSPRHRNSFVLRSMAPPHSGQRQFTMADFMFSLGRMGISNRIRLLLSQSTGFPGATDQSAGA